MLVCVSVCVFISLSLPVCLSLSMALSVCLCLPVAREQRLLQQFAFNSTHSKKMKFKTMRSVCTRTLTPTHTRSHILYISNNRPQCCSHECLIEYTHKAYTCPAACPAPSLPFSCSFNAFAGKLKPALAEIVQLHCLFPYPCCTLLVSRLWTLFHFE